MGPQRQAMRAVIFDDLAPARHSGKRDFLLDLLRHNLLRTLLRRLEERQRLVSQPFDGPRRLAGVKAPTRQRRPPSPAAPARLSRAPRAARVRGCSDKAARRAPRQESCRLFPERPRVMRRPSLTA